jgi:hypothetical protein
MGFDSLARHFSPFFQISKPMSNENQTRHPNHGASSLTAAQRGGSQQHGQSAGAGVRPVQCGPATLASDGAMQTLHAPLGVGGQPDYESFWQEANEYLGQLSAMELRAYFTKMRLCNQVLARMKQQQHTFQQVAQQVGKPVHVVQTWFGPYHQFTLQQISELESYMDGLILLAPLTPIPFPREEDNLPF